VTASQTYQQTIRFLCAQCSSYVTRQSIFIAQVEKT